MDGRMISKERARCRVQSSFMEELTDRFPAINSLVLDLGDSSQHAGFCKKTVIKADNTQGSCTESEFNLAQLCTFLLEANQAQKRGATVTFTLQKTHRGNLPVKVVWHSVDKSYRTVFEFKYRTDRITAQMLQTKCHIMNQVRGLEDTEVGAYTIEKEDKGYTLMMVQDFGGGLKRLSPVGTAGEIMAFLDGFDPIYSTVIPDTSKFEVFKRSYKNVIAKYPCVTALYWANSTLGSVTTRQFDKDGAQWRQREVRAEDFGAISYMGYLRHVLEADESGSLVTIDTDQTPYGLLPTTIEITSKDKQTKSETYFYFLNKD